jgi:hypothetical protein
MHNTTQVEWAQATGMDSLLEQEAWWVAWGRHQGYGGGGGGPNGEGRKGYLQGMATTVAVASWRLREGTRMDSAEHLHPIIKALYKIL